ncbi:MAG: 4Fe-4S single cluster domain [Pseudonocardiales bacterium]|nr:4Fe-4S single cluster domain [Pseudonocardiales bacterium]
MRAEIDADLCMGYGECVQVAPRLFALDADVATVIGDQGDWQDEAGARLAAAQCPTQAITLTAGPA